MAGGRHKEAARARLSARAGQGDDSELIDQALNKVAAAVDGRSPLPGDDASREVSAEVRRMRAEKRAKEFVNTHRRG